MIHIISRKAVLTSLVMLGAVVIAAVPASAQVAFSATSFAQLARVEGLNETVGAVTLTANAGGTINAGSSIIVTYGAAITGVTSPSTGYVTTAGSPVAPTSVSVSGSQVSLVFGTAGVVAGGASYTVSQVRLNINSLGSAATQVFATLSGTAPSSAQITFTQSSIQVAQIVNSGALKSVKAGGTAGPLQTCALSGGTAFSVVGSENYPAALTSASDESNFTPSFTVSNGTNVVVTLAGVPSGLAVAFVSFTGTGTLAATTPSTNLITSTGANITYTFPMTGVISGAARSFTINFAIGLPSTSTAFGSGSLTPLGATVTPTAQVSIGPNNASSSVVSFAANTQGSAFTVATIGDCVTNLLFPYVTNATGSGFDSSFSIANTTSNASSFGTGVGAAAQSGTCVVTLFPTTSSGAAGTAVSGTTPTIPAGAVYTFSISSAFSGTLSGQTGYVIAVCRFLNAHGFAFLTSGFAQATAKQISHGYLGLVLPNPVGGRVGTPTGNGEILVH